MLGVIPITMEILGVKPDLADQVIRGLVSGEYERVGGVIRLTDSKRIVTWLRTATDPQLDLSKLLKLGPLMQLTAATSLLNLTITAVGFAMVMKKLNVIQQKLDAIVKVLAEVNRKLDLSFYANFQAALDLAHSAFAMQGEANRRTGATQAINRFLEAEHHYLGLLDMEMEAGSLAVAPFLNTLILTYVCVARCYLELDEIQSARDHLQQGNEVLASRVHKYYDSVIGVNPAIYLHPQLADDISLSRLTQVLRHDDPTLAEAVVFESLRELFWKTASEKPEAWLKKLPEAIWRHEVDSATWTRPLKWSRSKQKRFERLLPRLSEAFTQVERAIESVGCVKGFQIELNYLIEKNISFQDWQQIELPATTPEDPIVLLIPQGSELLLET